MRLRTRGLPLQLVILCSLLMMPLSTAQPTVASVAAGNAQSTPAAHALAPAGATARSTPPRGQDTSARGRAATPARQGASAQHGPVPHLAPHLQANADSATGDSAFVHES